MADAPKPPMTDNQIPSERSPDAIEQQSRDVAAMTDRGKDAAGAVATPMQQPSRPKQSDAQPAPGDPTTANTTAVGSEPESAALGKGKDSAPPSTPAKTDEDDSAILATSEDAGPKATSGDEGPVCVITLLVSSGKKHPYKIDEKYLAKRSVDVPGITATGHRDPFSISVYTLKELILREWREEWEPKPTSPTLIRLIHFGKLLADKDQLNQYKFSAETSNVVHMSVRPMEIIEEDEPKGGSKSNRDGRSGDGGARCCVIL